MILIKNKQTDAKSPIKRFIINMGIGLLFILLGYIAQNNMSSIIKSIKGIIKTTSDFFSEFIVPINNLNIFSILLLLLGIAFLVKGVFIFKGVIKNKKELKRDTIFSKLPDNYYIFTDVHIGQNNIPNILVCPKGIYTIHTKQINDKNKENTFAVIKQSILQSKTLNDFLQEYDIGNFYVKTIVILDEINDKVKTHFPELPVMQPDKFSEYIDAQDLKYTDDECKKFVMLLKSNICNPKENIGCSKLEAEKTTNNIKGSKSRVH